MKKELFRTSLLMVLMALVGCSGNEEFDGTATKPEPKTWKVSVVATSEDIVVEDDADPETRAIFYGGNSGKRFSHIWDDGDKVEVYYSTVKLGELTPSVLGQESTTLTGTLEGLLDPGDELKLYLPTRIFDYQGQDGSLGTLSSTYAYQKATVTLKAENFSGGSITLPATKLTHQQAYIRFRLLDEHGNRLHPTKLQVFSASNRMVKTVDFYGVVSSYFTNENPLEVVTASENGEYPNEVFVAINTDLDASDTYTFKAWVGEDIYEGPAVPLNVNFYTRKGKLVSVVRTTSVKLADVTSAHVGWVITSDGYVFETIDLATAAGRTPVALIAYVGTPGSVDSGSATYRALAISLENSNVSLNKWYRSSTDGCLPSISATDDAVNDKGGIYNTITALAHDNEKHEAAKNCRNYVPAAPKSEGTSDWFIPSLGQWQLIVQGLASKKAGSPVTTPLSRTVNAAYSASNLNGVLEAAGLELLGNKIYWSSTVYNTEKMYCMSFENGLALYKEMDHSSVLTRPVLAF